MYRVGLPGPGHPKESELNSRKDRLTQVLGVKVRGKAYSERWSEEIKITSLVAQACNLGCLQAETGESQVQG